MEQKTTNEVQLLRIFIKGDYAYIQQKTMLTQREMNILIGAFSEIVEFAKKKPEIREGKQWTN